GYHCKYPDGPFYILISSLVSFYIPLTLMLYVYIRIYIIVRRQLRSVYTGFIVPKTHSLTHSYIPKFHLTTKPLQRIVEITTTSISSTAAGPPLILTTAKEHHTRQDLMLRVHCGGYQNTTTERKPQSQATPKNRVSSFFGYFIRYKAATFLSLLIIVFLLCWLPFFIYFISSGVFFTTQLTKSPYKQRHLLLNKIFLWLAYTHSAIDFFLYPLTSNELRTAFIKLLFTRKRRLKIRK
ncbi:unnamed protein product, partial [Didymodactylos carnosus]